MLCSVSWPHWSCRSLGGPACARHSYHSRSQHFRDP
jgi:hypothetical protein